MDPVKKLTEMVKRFQTLVHDMRSMLFHMQMSMELLHNAIKEGRTEEALKLSETCQQSLKRVRDITTSAELEKAAPTSLIAALMAVNSEFATLDKSMKVAFDFQLGDAHVNIRFTELYRIIYNLFKNAVEAMASMTSGRSLMLVVRKTGDQASFSIWNSGPHIKTDQNNPETPFRYIFERGYTTKGEGSGLGLAVVKDLVSANGGKIHVKNKGTGGVEFSVSMPACEPKLKVVT